MARRKNRETEMEKILTGEQLTDNLNKRLEKLSPDSFAKYISELQETPSIKRLFDKYIEHYGVSRTDIVNRSEMSKSYAYEILNGVKENPSRDSLIRLCLGAHMDLNTTQYTLKVGGAGELYAKVPRDAAIMIHINQKEWNVVKLNIFLDEKGLKPLQ